MLTFILRQIWLYFVQSFPCIFVRSNVRVECESSVKICEESEVCNWLKSRQSTKGHMKSTCCNLNSCCQVIFHESLHNSGQVARYPRNSLFEPFWNVFFSFLYQHHISPHYPRNCNELFREKTLAIHLRFRDYKPTIIYTISLSFSLLLPLQLQILESS